jgi:Rrf2 family protein
MKFSTKATYGLSAMLHLADRYGESAVSVSQIARDEGISASYLEQLLNRLKKNHWVKSVRGPQGGYVLTEKPSDIRIGDLLEALGESVKVSQGVSKPRGNARAAQIASLLFWSGLSKAIEKSLQTITLQDLISKARKSPDSKGSSDLTFNI